MMMRWPLLFFFVFLLLIILHHHLLSNSCQPRFAKRRHNLSTARQTAGKATVQFEMTSVVDDVLAGMASPSRDNMSSIMGISPVNKKNDTNNPSVLGSDNNTSINSSTIQQREIVRIHELWQKAKAELRAKSRELADLRVGLRSQIQQLAELRCN